MTRRERVQAALEHRQPDTVPIDLGGCDSSSFVVGAYTRLCAHLGLDCIPRVWEICQQAVLVDMEVQEALGGDVIGIHPEPARWREDATPDGAPCLVPDLFRPQRQADGTDVTFTADGQVALKRSAGGDYFYNMHHAYAAATSEADFDRHPDPIEQFDWADFWDLPIADMAARAKTLRETTDYFLAGNVYDHILAAGQILRGMDTFMMDLLIDKPLAHALMERLVETYLRRFEEYMPVAEQCDIIVVNDDLGTQAGPQLSPELYREMVKPYHARLWQGIKARCGKPLLLHSCGSIYKVMGDIIEAGINAVNPVQVSAADMDTARLKREFGRDITFWGGGCDTQYVLPRGSVQEVRVEVRRRVADLSEGGGFVFCPVHNVQPDVPPENIVACYEAAREFGGACG